MAECPLSATGDALRVEVLATPGQADDLSPDDYRTIYDELRDGISLDRMLRTQPGEARPRLDSQYTKGTWGRYEATGKLNEQMKDDLRRAVGLPPRPRTAAEAVQDIHPLAEVVRVSNGHAGPARRVVMLATHENVTLRWMQDGQASVEGAPEAHTESAPAAPARADAQTARVRPRTRAVRGFSVPARIGARLEAVRAEIGGSWGATFERLIEAYERGKEL